MYGILALAIGVTRGQSVVHATWLAGAATIGLAIGGPIRSRAVDRRGPRATLIPLAIGHFGLMLSWAIAVSVNAPLAIQLIAAVAACGTPPPVLSCLRAGWGTWLSEQDNVRSALALQASAQNVVSVAGPALTAVVLATAGATAGLLVCGALVLSGTVIYILATRELGAAPPSSRASVATVSITRLTRRLAPYLGIALCMGLVGGVLQVVALAVLSHVGDINALGLCLAIMPASATVVGAVSTYRIARRPAGRRLTVCLAGLSLPLMCLVIAEDSVLVLALVLFICGAIGALNQIAFFEVVGAAAPDGAEIVTWSAIASAGAVGGTIGVLVAGLISRFGVGQTSLLATFASLVAWALSLRATAPPRTARPA
jgi:predicted MFS family arabinose efflux permease